jgi:DNA-binding transcriptional regulator YhcF (GntR family)
MSTPSPRQHGQAVSQPKYAQVADDIRAQIESGNLASGQPAPSGVALARTTGYSAATCRRALGVLLAHGELVPGSSRYARPRVPGPADSHERAHADAARSLSAELAGRRRVAGLTQSQLSEVAGVSVTSIGHAESGRLWQSRRFWEQVDQTLSANGELLLRHDAYRASQIKFARPSTIEACTTAFTAPAFVAKIAITWSSGEVTTLYPSQSGSITPPVLPVDRHEEIINRPARPARSERPGG